MRASREVWCVIPAFSREILETRVGGKSLLEIAIRSADIGKAKAFEYVMVATDDEAIAGAAQTLGAALPRQLLMPRPEDPNDHRASSFHSVDFFVKESEDRIYRWGSPQRFVSINPWFPQKSFNTINDVYRGCGKDTMAVPVLDIFPGLVMPIWSVMGHRYSPAGTRPHEDYQAFTAWNNRKHFSVNMVRVNSLSEVADCRDLEVIKFLNAATRNRSWRMRVDIGSESLYVPVTQKGATPSWAAYLPRDAPFVYDAAHDKRVFNGERYVDQDRPRVVQQPASSQARPNGHRPSAVRAH